MEHTTGAPVENEESSAQFGKCELLFVKVNDFLLREKNGIYNSVASVCFTSFQVGPHVVVELDKDTDSIAFGNKLKEDLLLSDDELHLLQIQVRTSVPFGQMSN